MQPLRTSDLWPLPVYEGVRDQFRREVIAAKQHRRVPVGPFMSFVFENRLTVKFQIQEILRVERITAPELVREELDGFNDMLPGDGELSATLLIELQGDDAAVKAQLARLSGLSEHVWLELAGARTRGIFEGGRDDGTRVSAVQYLRFLVGGSGAASARQKLEAGPAALVIEHPAYRYRQELGEATRRSLAQDLA